MVEHLFSMTKVLASIPRTTKKYHGLDSEPHSIGKLTSCGHTARLSLIVLMVFPPAL